jgi:hypothetical protein
MHEAVLLYALYGAGLQFTDCACDGNAHPIPPAAASKIKIPDRDRDRDNDERASARWPVPPQGWLEASSETTTSWFSARLHIFR